MLGVKRASAVVLAGVLFAGCASVPKEAPELSVELGQRISAIEGANITLLHRYFDLKRDEVDRFLYEEWVPVFAEEIFKDEKIRKVWSEVVKSTDDNDRLQFLVRVGTKLQAKINERRLEFIQPLDKIERRIEEHLRDDYNEARAINNALTSFLLSASEVAANRNRYLEKIGITDDSVGATLDKIDDAVTDLLGRGKLVETQVKRGERFVKRIREVRDGIAGAEE